jgi:sulfite exporter TauE/SafE
MLGLFAAVLAASLVGSPHCAGMCGPLAVLAASAPACRSSWRRLLGAYHGGRLVGYASLGAVAGAFGAAVDLSGGLLGAQRVAATAAGAAMIAFGLWSLLRLHRGSSLHVGLPRGWDGLLRAAHRRVMRLTPTRRALGIGLLTVFLPCGWLYAFVIVAAGAASPWLGAAAMGSFWLGTLPALTAVALGVRSLAGRWRPHLPLATSLLLVATGVGLVAARAWTDYGVLGPTTAADLDVVRNIARAQELDSREAPCCDAE